MTAQCCHLKPGHWQLQGLQSSPEAELVHGVPGVAGHRGDVAGVAGHHGAVVTDHLGRPPVDHRVNKHLEGVPLGGNAAGVLLMLLSRRWGMVRRGRGLPRPVMVWRWRMLA